MDQLPINLGADGGFNGGVVNTAENAGFGTHFDAIAGLDIAFHQAVQHDIGDDDRALDTSLFAHRQRGAAAHFAPDIAVDMAIEMKPADELDIAVDPRLRTDQRVDFSFLIRFRFEHLPHLCPEYRRSLPFPPTFLAPSRRRPAGNYD